LVLATIRLPLTYVRGPDWLTEATDTTTPTGRAMWQMVGLLA
jgi:hypothetical protein